jgi:hypothetical protein
MELRQGLRCLPLCETALVKREGSYYVLSDPKKKELRHDITINGLFYALHLSDKYKLVGRFNFCKLGLNTVVAGPSACP